MTKKWKCENQFHSCCSECYDLRLENTFVEEDGLEPLTLLPLPPNCWDGSHASSHWPMLFWNIWQSYQEDNCECQHLFLPDVRITGIWAAVLYSLARIRSSRAATLSQNSPEIVQKALG